MLDFTDDQLAQQGLLAPATILGTYGIDSTVDDIGGGGLVLLVDGEGQQVRVLSFEGDYVLGTYADIDAWNNGDEPLAYVTHSNVDDVVADIRDTTSDVTDDLGFSGDWELNETLDAYEIAYTAVRFADPVSYGVCPIVTPDTMSAIVARTTLLRACGEPMTALQWDGNGVMLTDEQTDDVSWLLPDDDGNFDLSGLGWCWSRITPTDNVIRTVPETVVI